MKITSREKSCRKLTGEHKRTDSVSQLAILKQIITSSVDCILCGIIIPENFTSLLSIKAKHVSGLTLSFKMQRARYPCRHLNSRTIKSAALCYLSPVLFWENVVLSVQSVLARFRKRVLKVRGMACVELGMPVIKLCKVCLCVCCFKFRDFLSLFRWNKLMQIQ